MMMAVGGGSPAKGNSRVEALVCLMKAAFSHRCNCNGVTMQINSQQLRLFTHTYICLQFKYREVPVFLDGVFAGILFLDTLIPVFSILAAKDH